MTASRNMEKLRSLFHRGVSCPWTGSRGREQAGLSGEITAGAKPQTCEDTTPGLGGWSWEEQGEGKTRVFL